MTDIDRKIANWQAQCEQAAAAAPADAAPLLRQPNDLEILGDKHRPSKRNHNYLRYYGHHLEAIRHSARRVLEIGVETPRSLELWEEYFPNAEIVGIDIDPACTRAEGGRRRVFIGDQQDAVFLDRVVAECGSFDAIIDDGLHTERSIMTSFCRLLPSLNEGGFYVVEDIIDMPDVLRFFSWLGERVSHWPASFAKRDWAALKHFPTDVDWLTRNVIGVSLHRYICFVERGRNPEVNPFLLTMEEYQQKKSDLRREVNATIDILVSENVTPTPAAVSERMGNRGLTTIREEMAKRGLL